MDGVTAPTLGKSEVLALADSERSARPESPTSPNVVIGTYRGNKTSVPNARGRIVIMA